MALKRAPRALGDQRMGRKGRASPGRDGSPFAPPVCVSSAGLSSDMASSEPHLNGGGGGGWEVRGPGGSFFAVPSRSGPRHLDTARGWVLQESSGDRDTRAEDGLRGRPAATELPLGPRRAPGAGRTLQALGPRSLPWGTLTQVSTGSISSVFLQNLCSALDSPDLDFVMCVCARGRMRVHMSTVCIHVCARAECVCTHVCRACV